MTGNDLLQTVNTMGIMGKYDWAVPPPGFIKFLNVTNTYSVYLKMGLTSRNVGLSVCSS